MVLIMIVVPSVTADDSLLTGHPRFSYQDVSDIDAMEDALRQQLSSQSRYSFSRGWWKWDRLRARYVDGGRRDENSLRILRAVFRGLILDWHRQLEERGEGDLLYLFFTTNRGDKTLRKLEGRDLVRDVHGGGSHGGWGGAARMRIYAELVRGNMLTAAEQQQFESLVRQSLEPRIVEFDKTWQGVNNHTFGNGGGIALALKYFPDVPQANEAQAWLDDVWNQFSEYGDWKEWTYYPYGPIFLHGMLDIAEATGRIETEQPLINAVAERALGFIHGGGIRGNPNAGSRVRVNQQEVYEDPWNVGYYNVETSARDGHFWYRLAQHYRNPEYLWAAEQVNLGGRPPDGMASAAYLDAYQRRYSWFIDRNIEPSVPKGNVEVALLSRLKRRVPERLHLRTSREAGQPFVGFFLYDPKDAHLDNVSGHLFEYSYDGAKLLHSSGKYNNVYSGDQLKGGGTGEESLDLLLVMQRKHEFPLHPDRQGDDRDLMRRGQIHHRPESLIAERNAEGDCFGQYGFDDYYGPESRWTRRVVLTANGILAVVDEYQGGAKLGDDYRAGPVWHLAQFEPPADSQNWFDAPAFDRAWWQTAERRLLLYFHDDGTLDYGTVQQRNSQDTDANVTTFASRPIQGGKQTHFLSVFVPHDGSVAAEQLVERIQSTISETGEATVRYQDLELFIGTDGEWRVTRNSPATDLDTVGGNE